MSSVPNETNLAQTWIFAIVGALVGGVAGFFLFRWLLVGFGLYAAAIPGAFVGLGAGYLQTRRNAAVGIFAGIAALMAGIYSDYFVTIGAADIFEYLTGQGPATWLMIALGTYVGYSYGGGSDRMPRN